MGEPLVLLHGIGCSRDVWAPVVPRLATRFDVLVVDLPGFGDSEALPASVEPSPAVLAQRVATLLDELDIAAPHIVGNSLGGWIALELAALRPVNTVTLLSPAGLWHGPTPHYCLASLKASRWLALHAQRPLLRLVRSRLGRALVLGQTHGRPLRMSADDAARVIRTMASCPAFDAALQATADRHYVRGPVIDAPVSVAFGSRDHLLLRRQSRHLDELPADTRVGILRGCGHVPMADDPAAVTAFVTASVARGGARGAPVNAASSSANA